MNNGLSYTVMLVCAVVSLITLYYIAVLMVEVFKKERRFKSNGIKGLFIVLMSFALMGGFAYCLYNAPYILLNGLNWTFIEEFGPTALTKVVLCLSVLIPIFILYFNLSCFFEKPHEKPFFMIIVLSIISGLGNSLVIFIINSALNVSFMNQGRNAALESGLHWYFILGIALFTVCAMVVRKKLISITSNVVYGKRMEIINSILKAPYEKFEAIEEGKTYAALNNDTEAISGFVNMFVSGLTGIITMLTCFIYLGTLNFYGMLLSVAVILTAVVIFMKTSESAEKLFEKNRDYQNIFFKYINDLTRGFKELGINRKKRDEFRKDMQDSCEKYRDTRIQGEYRFVGASILGEIMYISVIGFVVFVFPILFLNVRGDTLRNYVLVCLYMGGIVNQEIFLIPGMVRIFVSWKRVNAFIKEILTIENAGKEVIIDQHEEDFVIQMKEYRRVIVCRNVEEAIRLLEAKEDEGIFSGMVKENLDENTKANALKKLVIYGLGY